MKVMGRGKHPDMKVRGHGEHPGVKARGRVEQGSKVGREMGYPTANIASADIPADVRDGVYAATAHIGGRCYGALAYLGTKPTFASGGGRVLELHLLDFTGDIYGEDLEAELLDFIRPDRKFASREMLLAQISEDKKKILKILKKHGNVSGSDSTI